MKIVLINILKLIKNKSWFLKLLETSLSIIEMGYSTNREILSLAFFYRIIESHKCFCYLVLTVENVRYIYMLVIVLNGINLGVERILVVCGTTIGSAF